MNKRTLLTPAGPEFSRLITGLWRTTEVENTREILQASIEHGISTFDNADIYGSYTCEDLFGKAWSDSDIKREDFEIISKCGIKLISPNRPENTIHEYDTSSSHIFRSVRNSIEAMKCEYLDLLLIHRPDPLMDPDEIADAFNTLHKEGMVIEFGVSNFTSSQFDMLQARIDVPLVTNQIEISPFQLAPFTNGDLDLAVKHRFKPMAWSPFGGGKLFNQAEIRPELKATLESIGNRYDGATIDLVVLAWLMRHPAGILPVLGTTKPERIGKMAQALDIELTNSEWFEIYVAARGEDIP